MKQVDIGTLFEMYKHTVSSHNSYAFNKEVW